MIAFLKRTISNLSVFRKDLHVFANTDITLEFSVDKRLSFSYLLTTFSPVVMETYLHFLLHHTVYLDLK